MPEAESEADLFERWHQTVLCFLYEVGPIQTHQLWVSSASWMVHPSCQFGLGLGWYCGRSQRTPCISVCHSKGLRYSQVIDCWSLTTMSEIYCTFLLRFHANNSGDVPSVLHVILSACGYVSVTVHVCFFKSQSLKSFLTSEKNVLLSWSDCCSFRSDSFI